MAEKERLTDGRSGMDAAEKFKNGDLESSTAIDSYNGFGFGSSSLQNVTENSKREVSNNPRKKDETKRD